MPTRIQRQRTKGWKMPANTAYVGRPTIWGNPFFTGHPSGCGFKDGGDPTPLIASLSLEQCIDFYRTMASGGLSPEMHPYGHAHLNWFRGKVRGMSIAEAARVYLRGKDLACWCPFDKPCHADVLLELANR